ncbi:cell death protein Grim [Teleopsis dalmanni]|uniref:cell death protein Grim n=1 Tax=Teleopsis dalmanni TaxID=139649 RepID=UPI0018CDD522|nr:cell death protein Grim [Teleopsis dalmanni]
MAIAYYIPDQSKLIAGNSSSNNSNNHNASSTQNSNQNTSSADPNATNPARNANEEQSHRPQEQPNNFRANITIPLASYGSTHRTVGCWDLITQVFCYALRFYNESSNLNPTVIQISFEISGNNASTTPTTQQEQPTSVQSPRSSTSPTRPTTDTTDGSRPKQERN